MKKFYSRIFSAALMASLIAIPSYSQIIPRDAAVNSDVRKADVTTRAQAVPAKPVEKGHKPFDFSRVRKAPTKLRTAKQAPNAPMKAPAMNAAGDAPELYGSVGWASSWGYDAHFGIYTIPTQKGQSFQKRIATDDGWANFGGVLYNGVYYFNYYQDYMGFFQVYSVLGYNISTGEQVYKVDAEPDPSVFAPGGMDVDPITGDIYGIFFDENIDLDSYELATISYAGAYPKKRTIAPIVGSFEAFAIDSKGQFYGILDDPATGEGILCKIDRKTAAVTKIGKTGFTNYYMTGACIDRNTDRMYWTLALADDTGFIVEVDLNTGKATRLYDFPGLEEVAGLYVPTPEALSGAPAACTNVAANYDGESLAGTISFKAPTTTFGGSQLVGNVDVTLLVDGEVNQTLTGIAPGANGAFNFTAPAVGAYSFTVFATNAAGNGPKTKLDNVWIGADTPAATRATLVYRNGNMEVSWNAVSESINGGYLDLNNLSYRVTRFDGTVVAEGLTTTSWSEAVPLPETIVTYYYTVEVVCNGIASAPARTNSIVIGQIVPPYTSDFLANLFDGWTVINSNFDENEWVIMSDGSVRCYYNPYLPMDDWLITPPFRLEQGYSYEVSFQTRANNVWNVEKLEVKYGTSATVAGMTNTLLEPVEVVNNNYVTYTKMLTPTQTGVYYIGFHGISDPDAYYLELKNISVQAGVGNNAPAAVSNLKATPGAGGALNCNVSFVAPRTTSGGSTLLNLTKIDVLRDNTVVKTFDSPTPGSSLSFDDVFEKGGEVNYTVIPYNTEGAGRRAQVSAFIGFDVPYAPSYVTVSRTSVPGQALVEWDPVTQDLHGNILTANNVTYTVCIYDEKQGWVPLVEDMKGTTYSFQAVPAGEQQFVQVSVFAKTTGGTSKGSTSDLVPIGTPYNGLAESYADGENHYIWGFESIYLAGGEIYSDDRIQGVPSFDDDNGYLAIKADYIDDGASVISGLISLDQIENPALTFYTYNIIALNAADYSPILDDNEISVSVKAENDQEWTEVLAPITISEIGGDVQDWYKVQVSLSQFANKTIQFKLTGVIKVYAYVLFDNIKVGSVLGHDLAAVSITAPAKTNAGDDFKINVKVANEGAQTAQDYSVELYADQELVATENCSSLASGEFETVTFTQNMPAIANEPISYYAKVVYSLDENVLNNQTSSISVMPVISSLPVATGLNGESVEGGIKLTWNAPNMGDGIPMPVTDDFESAESFAVKYGGWKFVDEDGAAVGGMLGVNIPGITPGSTTGSFWVWDNTVMEGNAKIDAHSGNHFLFALFNHDTTQSDNWAISPELYGGPQTISFYAKSYNPAYAEKFQVYYSTSGRDIEDFVAVPGSLVSKVPGEWTQYTYSLPSGAKYLAIRSFGTDSYMLMIDDVTFALAGDGEILKIAGYNVYRNGNKVNKSLVTTTEYIDTTVATNVQYTYVVAVVYENVGESSDSNPVTLFYDFDGIDSVNGALSIEVRDNKIVIANAEGQNVNVASVNGALVYAGRGEAKTEVEVGSGVYVVKAGNVTRKVIVK